MHVYNGHTKMVAPMEGGKCTIGHEHDVSWKARMHAKMGWALRIT